MENDKLLTSKEAADFLNYKEATMRHSRVTGKLGGDVPPRVTMLGASVRYKMSDLIKWINGL